MKFVNFYSGTAMVLIASILGNLGSATGELAPPLVLGALLATVLVLGWAGGASDARHELDRLTRLEAGRQLKATCDAAARDRLETAAEVLRAQLRDSQAAIKLFTAAQAKNMIRITALEGENAELHKRPAIDVTLDQDILLTECRKFVATPPAEVICAIEAIIDQQLRASGIQPMAMLRQDGQQVWESAMDALVFGDVHAATDATRPPEAE